VDLIAPCLGFDGEAETAASFYGGLPPDSAVTTVSRYGEGAPVAPETEWMVEFRLAGRRFQTLYGGPRHRHSAAMSLSTARGLPSRPGAALRGAAAG
jgi:predicted 3-demethylubiquinone-9 3-methyltransferase (glyoxalase superfamily)